MAVKRNILVIGAGELGQHVLRSLVAHPHLGGVVAVLMRPASIASTSPTKQREIAELRGLGVYIVPGDIMEDSASVLASKLAPYYTVIGCAGFVCGPNVQIKLTRAALEAGVSRYIPWQFGVDYDAIGRGSAQDLFDEQLDVRDLLRSQEGTSWAVVSTGMFTSFLFEPFFGVVDVENDVVRALGSWENRVTLTTPEDIGRMTAEFVLGAEVASGFPNKPVFIGGDTVTYEQVALLVERVVGRSMKREVIRVEDTAATLAQDPENGLAKYYGVFGQGHGVAWDIQTTWNYERGIKGKTAEEWARENLV